MEERQPEYLYHYTTVDKLALILGNRTFRFTPLDQMDDLQEQETADVKGAAKLCYVSSWTEMSEESIPMWNMYASLKSGVRIRLRKQPFKTYEVNPYEVAKVIQEKKGGDINVSVTEDAAVLYSLIPITEMMRKGFYSQSVLNIDNFLTRVEYTNSLDKLKPTMLHNEDNGSLTLLTAHLGTCKSMAWSFQKEWRYLFIVCPYDLVTNWEQGQQLIGKYIIQTADNTVAQPFPWYDMRLDDDAFEEMEITMSPCISAGNKVIVQELVKGYNPAASVSESALSGLIR